MSHYLIQQLDRAEWQSLLDSAPFYTPFHTPEWAALIQDAFGVETRAFSLTQTDTQAVTLITPQFRKMACFKLSSQPFRDLLAEYTGPLPITGTFIDAMNASEWWLTTHEMSDFSEIRSFPETNVQGYSGRYALEQQSTLRIDLSGGEEAVFARMNKAVRKRIRKADEIPIEFEWVSKTGDWIEDYIRAASTLYTRMGIESKFTNAFFQSVCNHLLPANLASVVICRVDGKFAAAQFITHAHKIGYAQGVVSVKEFDKLNVQTILQGHILKELIQRGWNYYDLCGAGIPRLVEYKRSLGAEEALYWNGTFVKPGLSKLALCAYKKIIPLIRRIRSKS